MKTTHFLLALSIVPLYISAFESYRSHYWQGSKINPLNPNYSYPEVNIVNKSAGNLPYLGEMFSGYITVNQTSQSKIFYVLYAAGGNIKPKATVNDSAPLILWLQGGPGCADFGSYFQMGPFNILWDSHGNPLPVPNGITWNEKYHMLFIDEPVGVGYSVCGGDLPRNSVENAYQLQNFISRFFEIYTSLKSQDFYILGDSYAGHFIPALATVMIQNYTQNGIRITGIGLGDGWVDPARQVEHYGASGFAAGVLDLKSKEYLKNVSRDFQEGIKNKEYKKCNDYIDDFELTIMTMGTGNQNNMINIMNYRNNSESSSNCYDWLNSQPVKQLFAADPNVFWQGCVDEVGNAFNNDLVSSYESNMTFLLTQTVYNLKVLLYTGQDDLLVTYPGVLNYVKNLKWSGTSLFISSPNYILRDTNNDTIGTFQHYGKLSLVLANKAGHSVPQDQPWTAWDIVRRFVEDDWDAEEVGEI